MGAKSRRKGANGEREVVRRFVEHGIDARRTSPLQAGSASALPDVDVRGFWIEVKRSRRPLIRAALAQAEAQSQEHYEWTKERRIPVAVTRGDDDVWLVTLHLSTAIELGLFDARRIEERSKGDATQ